MPLVDDDGNPVSQTPPVPLGGVLLDDSGNPVAPTSAAKVGRGVLVDDSGMPLTHADAHRAFVARYPGDPISKIEERRTHPPPNARGSVKPADDGSAWDYAAAIAKGVGGMLPDITGGATDPFAIVRNAVETGRTAAQYMGTPTGSAQAAISAVPVVGAPLAAVAQPARAYVEGRPPTHEENVSAVEGGTTLATMAALPAALRVANVLRARGVPVEATSAGVDGGLPEAPGPNTPAPTADAINAFYDKRISAETDPARVTALEADRSAALGSLAAVPATPPPNTPESAAPPIIPTEAPAARLAPEGGEPPPSRQLSTEFTPAPEQPSPTPDQPSPTPPVVMAPATAGAPLTAASSPQAGSAPASSADQQVAAPPPAPPAIQGLASQPTPEPPPLPPVDDPQYGAALRTRYTGSVDVRVLEGNRIRSWMQKTLTPDEQNALSIMRDEKSQPGSTQALIDGTHPVYQEPNTSHAHVEAMSDVADLALNPTPAMMTADGVLDSYFAKTLKEGKEKGVIDSSIESSDYIPHLLQPAEGIEPGRTGSPGGISETTPFALKRKNPTILEAMARGLDPRTINAADAVSIYARRHGLAMAAQILENTLKESGIGKSVTAGNAPEGWAEVGEGTRAFKRQVPYHDETGKLPDGSNHIAVANQALYAPQKIADALKPITEPNYMLKVPGWEKTQRFQDYIKSANVALAFFHLKAVTITAFNSMRLGPVDMMKAYMIGVDDPAFIEAEQTLVQAGGKTSAVGQTAEAYRALQPTELPSRVDAIRNLPVMRQLDAAAQATSRLTFDVALRKTKVMDFASKDAAWIADHPNASDLELAEARRSTARTLNANYGGLNWEALGYTRTVHAILRATMFAPDWTISNLESVTQAARGGPGGAQARWYMARSIVGGIGATAAMTYFLTGKRPDQVPGSMKDKLFNVYLGDDEKGNHKFVNLFFAGAPNDAVNLAANVVDYGIGKGVGMSAATKTNVLPRLGMHVASNKDFMGRDIVPQGAGPVLGTGLSIENAAGEVTPVPFSVKNAAQMATDARREYSPAEYAAAMVAGVRPRHVADHGGKVPVTETKWVNEPPKNSAWDILTGSPVYKRNK